ILLCLRRVVKFQARKQPRCGPLPPRRLAICRSICSMVLYRPPQKAYVWAPMGNSRRVWVVVVAASLAAVSSAIASETSEVLTAKGQLAYAQGRSDEAVGLLERAVISDPRDAYAQNALGQVLLAQGRRD